MLFVKLPTTVWWVELPSNWTQLVIPSCQCFSPEQQDAYTSGSRFACNWRWYVEDNQQRYNSNWNVVVFWTPVLALAWAVIVPVVGYGRGTLSYLWITKTVGGWEESAEERDYLSRNSLRLKYAIVFFCSFINFAKYEGRRPCYKF